MRGGLILSVGLYPSFSIITTISLEPFTDKTCQNFPSQAPADIPSATLTTFVTGGDRSTTESSFKGFIWIFSVSGLTPFFGGYPIKITEAAGVTTNIKFVSIRT